MIDRRRFLGVLAAGLPLARLEATAGALGVPPGNPQSAPYVMVLGSVQDGGLPQAGCYTDRCNRARQDPRYVTSLVLSTPELKRPDVRRYYLADASPDLRAQMDLIDEAAFRRRAGNRRPFDGIFLTHAHMGHYLGLALMGREGLAIAPTPVYCSRKMQDFLTDNGPWSLMVREGRLHFPDVPVDEWFRVEEALDAKMILVPHRPEYSDTVAWVFRGLRRTVLYLPDIDAWNKWDRRVEDVVSDVDIALLDGSFFSPDEVPGRNIEDILHPMIPDTMDRLEPVLGGGRRIVFTHFNNTNPVLDEDGPEAAQVRRRGFELAREGTVFPL